MSKKMEFRENEDYVPNWEVEYVDTTGSQYTTIPLRSLDKSVWAKYVRNRRYPGNILIEAINRKRTNEEIFNSAECKIPYTSREEEIRLPADEQCDRILALIDWRIALPYQDEIEDAIDKTIISSYHRRYPAFDKNVRLEVYANSEKSYVNGKFDVPIEKDTGVTSVCSKQQRQQRGIILFLRIIVSFPTFL